MNLLPLELQAHIFSYSSLLDRAFIIPQVCKSWKLYMEGLKKPPLDELTKKVLLQWKGNHLVLLKRPLNLCMVLWRKNENRIVLAESPIQGDLRISLFFKMKCAHLEVKGRKLPLNVKLLMDSSYLTLSMYERDRWTLSRDIQSLQLVKKIVIKAFKLCIDWIAEKNLNSFIHRIKRNKSYRFACDAQGKIKRMVEKQSDRKKGWEYFLVEPVLVGSRNVLIWKDEIKSAEVNYCRLDWIFRGAVLSKTTKLFAEVLGYSYKI